jgi:hypothetical protein
MINLWMLLIGVSLFLPDGHVNPKARARVVETYDSYKACEHAITLKDPLPGYTFKCVEDAPT